MLLVILMIPNCFSSVSRLLKTGGHRASGVLFLISVDWFSNHLELLRIPTSYEGCAATLKAGMFCTEAEHSGAVPRLF